LPAGLALEAGSQIFTLGDVFRQDLDGDGAVEQCVAGLVHFSHATGPEQREDLIVPEFVAGR
jgi:hypothetical protein